MCRMTEGERAAVRASAGAAWRAASSPCTSLLVTVLLAVWALLDPDFEYVDPIWAWLAITAVLSAAASVLGAEAARRGSAGRAASGDAGPLRRRAVLRRARLARVVVRRQRVLRRRSRSSPWSFLARLAALVCAGARAARDAERVLQTPAGEHGSTDPRGRAARRLPERAGGHRDRRQGAPDRACSPAPG